MNRLERWFRKVRNGGEEEQDRAALVIASLLTAVAVYFLVMFWWGRFVNVSNLGQEVSVENNVVSERSFLESAQIKVREVFRNEQVVE
jgi:hypothetical protein